MSDGAAKPQTNGNNTQTRHTEMSLHTNTQQMKALTAGSLETSLVGFGPKGASQTLSPSLALSQPPFNFSVLVQVSLQEV